MRTAEIGQRFVDFFESKGHTVVPSASLLYNDPTLLFVNAGMVPFKPYLMGTEPSPWKRATSIQKCVRTLDIDEVGKTTRHGTFFQMLGNFSFGDYFKNEAIQYAWELVTKSAEQGGLGFDPASIWVTVLGPGFHPDYPEGDIEAREAWRAAGIPDEQIQGRSLKDNYWHMGFPAPAARARKSTSIVAQPMVPTVVQKQMRTVTLRSGTSYSRPRISQRCALKMTSTSQAHCAALTSTLVPVSNVLPICSRASTICTRLTRYSLSLRKLPRCRASGTVLATTTTSDYA